MTATEQRLAGNLDAIEDALNGTTDAWKMKALLDALDAEWAEWVPLPHQVPPSEQFYLWLLLAGRGSGKTDACAHYVADHVNGPPCDPRLPGGHRMGIIAPTIGDAADACFHGPSGLSIHAPTARLRSAAGGLFVEWPTGATAKLFGAHTEDDTNRLRAGGNRCLFWLEEFAAWRRIEEAWTNMRFGLRMGTNPHAVASTTPKNREMLKRLVKQATHDSRIRVTKASTYANPYLAADLLAAFRETYENTRIGKQELDAEILDDLGTRYQRAWFTVLDAAPPMDSTWKRVRYWDLAATEGPELEAVALLGDRPDDSPADWTVGALVAWQESTRSLVVEDQRWVRREAGRVEELLKQTAREDGPQVPVYVEQEPGASGKSQIHYLRGALTGIAKVNGHLPSGSKEVRSQTVESLAQQGHVALVRGPWTTAYLDQCEEFPEGDHDDAVDAVSGAAAVLAGTPGRRKVRVLN